MISLSWQTIVAALSFTAVAAFHLTTMENGLGFSKVFVYGAYALAFYRKKPLYLKLSRRKTPFLDVATQVLKHLRSTVFVHAYFLVFVFAVKNAGNREDGFNVLPKSLVLYLLLGAASTVFFSFRALCRMRLGHRVAPLQKGVRRPRLLVMSQGDIMVVMCHSGSNKTRRSRRRLLKTPV